MKLGLWPIRVRCSMNPVVVILVAVGCWTLAALVGWALVHVGARDDPPEWDEPEDLPTVDPRPLSFTISDPRWTWTSGPATWSGWRDGDHLN